jgi:hypothetical protein
MTNFHFVGGYRRMVKSLLKHHGRRANGAGGNHFRDFLQ